MKNTYIMVTIFLMFLFITAVHDPELDFGPPNTTLGILTNTCSALATAVADVFVIFRTFTVWNRNWFVIILPSLLFLGNVGSAIWAIVALITYNPMIETPFFVAHPVNAFIALSLCTNLLCTALISFRILHFNRQVVGVLSPGSDITRAISVIIESAAIYTLVLTASLITYSRNNYVSYILFDCLISAYNEFSYIIIRVRRGTSFGDSTEIKSTTIDSEGGPRRPTIELGSNRNTRSGTQSEVQVRLEQVLHHHRDEDTASNDDQAKYRG
ncbi:hypothetical protein C8R44DRAFT_805775 [Mycena epipterygia]|nr:hypothetical protein C8R44DRAFT_805775 [Mycena epipterygia]